MNSYSTKDLLKLWSQVAAHSFGGPAGQIAVIHKLVVEDKKIISEERFLHALNFCMLLPGPEAQQLATYMGFLMAKWRGGIIAGGLFILPGFLSILALSYIYVLFQDVTVVQGLFYGMKPAIIAIVLSSLLRISKKALQRKLDWYLAAFAFIALFFFQVPFPIVVMTSGLIGYIYGKFIRPKSNEHYKDLEFPKMSSTLKTISAWLFIWAIPIILTFYLLGPQSTLNTLNLFFSKMSLVTFGGAYAALSYVAQQGVEVYSWLTSKEMLDGLGLAETTPGPLIQVVQYVGFMAAYRFPGILSPLTSAFIGSVLTTWMTFVPCFLFIFTFAPYIEYIRGQKVISDALATITSAIVGVILNLSVWFILNTLFLKSKLFQWGPLQVSIPEFNSMDYYAVILCGLSIFLQTKLKFKTLTILGITTTLGILITLLK